MAKTQRIKAQCVQCKQTTNHSILASKDYSGATDNDDIHWWESYQIIQCCGCNQTSFRKTEQCTEDFDPYTGDLEVIEQLYPSRTEERPPIDGSGNFPGKTRRIYTEVLRALNHGAPILAAIGLRTLIESICIEQKTKAANLAKGIDELADMGLLSKKQAAYLHTHRFMGNVAAHEIVAPKPQELVAALDIAETLLKTIYVLPEVANTIKTGSTGKMSTTTSQT